MIDSNKKAMILDSNDAPGSGTPAAIRWEEADTGSLLGTSTGLSGSPSITVGTISASTISASNISASGFISASNIIVSGNVETTTLTFSGISFYTV